MKFSVISAASRPLSYMKELRHCFKNQTFKDFEHIVIYDGRPPENIIDYFKMEANKYSNLKFEYISVGDTDYFPYKDSGATPRNFGISIAEGDFLVFFDDDDICTKDYLKVFYEANPTNNNLICCQMKLGDSTLPGYPLEMFPVCCDVGTPQCAFPRHWLVNGIKWESGQYHDFDLIKKCVDAYRPEIKIIKETTVYVRGNIKEFYPEYEY